MVNKLRNPARDEVLRPGRVAGRVTMAALVCLNLASLLPAQTTAGYRCPRGVAAPGAIGSQQLQRGGPLIGVFAPVEIRAPRGVSVSMAVDGVFEPPQKAPLRVGMLVGPIYRIRVTNIPFSPGVEVFPSIEIVDRLYAPPGAELDFPIPVQLTSEELQMAADGKFVTRVIYLEDPHAAVPVANDEKEQSWFDVGPGKSPLAVARELGRPVAVLRLGGRRPQAGGDFDMDFLCGCPPFVQLGPVATPIRAADPRQSPPPAGDGQQEQGLQHSQLFDAIIARRPEPIPTRPQETAVEESAGATVGLSNRAKHCWTSQQCHTGEESAPSGVKTLPPPPSHLK